MPTGRIVLAVATWNMDAGRGDLPRLMSDLENGTLTSGRAETFALLLQEAVEEHSQRLAALANSRGFHLIYEPVRGTEARMTGNAILSNRPLRNRKAIVLPRERQPRGAVTASLDVAGEDLLLVSAHLENRANFWGTLFSDTVRRRQAEALVQALPENVFGVLGGDLNTWLGPNEAALRVLLDRFDDTPAILRSPTFRDRLVLDHLLFDVPDGWHVVARVSPDSYGSDHHPVIGALIL